MDEHLQRTFIISSILNYFNPQDDSQEDKDTAKLRRKICLDPGLTLGHIKGGGRKVEEIHLKSQLYLFKNYRLINRVTEMGGGATKSWYASQVNPPASSSQVLLFRVYTTVPGTNYF